MASGTAGTDAAGIEGACRVARALAAATRRFLAVAAFRDATRRLPLVAAFAAAVRRLRLVAAFRAAAAFRFRAMAAFFTADGVMASQCIVSLS